MSTSVSSVTKHFPSAEAGFTTTLASTISSGATTVPLNSVAGYANGEVVVFIVDPSDANKKQAFTGTVDTAGVQITGVVWTSGTNQTHTAGATVVDYASATHISMVSKGLLVEHNQNGTHGAITPTSIVSSGPITGTVGTFSSVVVSGTATSQGWTPLGATPNTVTANSTVPGVFDLVFNGTDLTGTLSDGMKLQATRTVAAPNQCTSLNGTTQYYSKSSPNGMTFTDDFVVSAWIKLSSYGSQYSIASRYNGTSGWDFQVNSTGQLVLAGFNGASGNVSYVTSYASVPLNKWVHVAAQLDMSAFTATTTTSYTMFDGVDVAASVTRAGSNPTALVQAGNLEIGSRNGSTQFFPGKIAQVAIYSAKVTQATILASINRGLTGSETSLISAYSFNNSINDLNANANNLTAQGSAVATNADSPFGNNGVSTTLEYAEVLARSFSTNTTVTVRVPAGCQLPTTGGISAMSYSTQSNPYGLPAFSSVLGQVLLASGQSTTSATSVQIPGLSCPVYIPAGRRVRVTTNIGLAISSSTLTYTLVIGTTDGTVGVGTTVQEIQYVNQTTSAGMGTGIKPEIVITPTAGVHTYNGHFRVTSGTLTISAGIGLLSYTSVELV